MKPILIAALIAFATPLASVFAADVPSQPFGIKDKLIFLDDFERTELGSAWKPGLPGFTVTNGVLVFQSAEHSGVKAKLPLPDGNFILEIKFRFSGASGISLGCDDFEYTGTHHGHISRIAIKPTLLTLNDDKEGLMRNDIYALRRSGDAVKIAEGDRLAKPAFVPVPFTFQPGQWYRLGWEVIGDRMRVIIDDKPVGYLQSPGLAYVNKHDLVLEGRGPTPNQEADFDEVRVWSVKSTVAK
ncbi:MAG: hypothetical protein WCK57_01885 [Verrucomicrobiae bacterium]